MAWPVAKVVSAWVKQSLCIDSYGGYVSFKQFSFLQIEVKLNKSVSNEKKGPIKGDGKKFQFLYFSYRQYIVDITGWLLKSGLPTLSFLAGPFQTESLRRTWKFVCVAQFTGRCFCNRQRGMRVSSSDGSTESLASIILKTLFYPGLGKIHIRRVSTESVQ